MVRVAAAAHQHFSVYQGICTCTISMLSLVNFGPSPCSTAFVKYPGGQGRVNDLPSLKRSPHLRDAFPLDSGPRAPHRSDPFMRPRHDLAQFNYAATARWHGIMSYGSGNMVRLSSAEWNNQHHGVCGTIPEGQRQLDAFLSGVIVSNLSRFFSFLSVHRP
jgi:hypothetical protein